MTQNKAYDSVYNMKVELKKAKNSLKKLLDFIPTQVPMGMTAFHSWADSLIETYAFPNDPSVKFALATMIMHLGPIEAYKPRRYFMLAIKAGAAKQIASAVFQEIKAKQIADQKQAEALALAAKAPANEAEEQRV